MTLQPRSALNATFGTAAGVSRFSCDNAILRERADIGCVLLTTAVDGADIATSASRAADVDLPLTPGMINTAPRRRAIWLSPRSWLIHCDVEEERELVFRLNSIFPDKCAHAAAFTDHLCWLEIAGAASLDLLLEGAFLSLERRGLPVGYAKRTLIAQVATFVVRESENGWLLAVERSRAAYFIDWLIAVAKES